MLVCDKAAAVAAAWSDTLKTQHRDGKASMTSSVLQRLLERCCLPQAWGRDESATEWGLEPPLKQVSPKLTRHLFSAQVSLAENRSGGGNRPE